MCKSEPTSVAENKQEKATLKGYLDVCWVLGGWVLCWHFIWQDDDDDGEVNRFYTLWWSFFLNTTESNRSQTNKPKETATRWSESPRYWSSKDRKPGLNSSDFTLKILSSERSRAWSYGVVLWPSQMASVRSTNQTKTPEFLRGSAGEVCHVLHIHQVVNREFIPHLHQVIRNLCSRPEPLPQICLRSSLSTLKN